MPDQPFRTHFSLREIPAATWDALTDGHPALAHAYLATLEDTGCVGPGTGWTPRHATLWQDHRLVAALPLYEKAHSYGEYVFDWAWAEAYARHGLAYYPKWLAAIPFSPLPGPRLLARDQAARDKLLRAVLHAAREARVSSLHILFPPEDQASPMAEAGMLLRQGIQFHWHNAGYRDFDDFLSRLNHDKRKKIRQERRRAQAGLTFTWLDGREASAQDWRFFHHCYALTYAAHRSTPYLSPAFFQGLARAMPESVRLLRVDRGDRPLAAAFFLQGPEALYGRYWGATEFVPRLHFEVCYYAAIEYAIAQGLARLEGGAQGEHKLARGLTPVRTWSAHWLREPAFADAVARYLERETEGVEAWLGELEQRSPFRQA
ncbi:MAG: GNAT family N-acetyltransferase [Rhodocyclaceae bacterium]|jgi:predicted N-acyltransferase|nr:GNAT family N-acetyltransferase [Rhodocyclaceae bacterium]